MKRFTTYLAAMAIGLTAMNAQAISLADLFAGGFIEVGDKIFDDWEELNNEQCPELDCISGAVDTANTNVEGVGDGTAGNEYGLQFTASEGALTQIGDNFLDLWFGFSVTSGPGQSIIGSTMSGTTATQGDEFLVVVEKDIFQADGATHLDFMEIYNDPLDGGASLADSGAFAGQSAIWVEDNIFIDGFGGSAELVELTQRFLQREDDVVPTPGTLALFALGLLGFALIRRRQYQRL
jgi:hypothetical protein